MSPRKATRSSPRKRDLSNPWGLGSKSPIAKAKYQSSPKKGRQLDFSDLEKYKNKSWIEMMEEEENPLSDLLVESKSKTTAAEAQVAGSSTDWTPLEEASYSPKTTARKALVPKKLDSKPRFVKSLAITESLMFRRSERLKKNNDAAPPAASERKPRKRNLSRDSYVTDNGKPSPSRTRAVPAKSMRLAAAPSTPSRSGSRTASFNTPERSLLSSASFYDSPNPQEGWAVPKLGWCSDPDVLGRRTKEIERAKDKDVYLRYINEVPKHSRKRTIHPKTPNKYINFSRRSWDVQMRAWKKNLYEWADLSPSPSVVGSLSSSVADDADLRERNAEELENDRPMPSNFIKDPAVSGSGPVFQPDQMASLLGHFDLHTRTCVEESTLKASSSTTQGPSDFSVMKKE